MLAIGLIVAYTLFAFVAWSILYVGAAADAYYDGVSESFPESGEDAEEREESCARSDRKTVFWTR